MLEDINQLTPAKTLKQEQGFNPYVDNGGTVLAISGKGFCVIASDTRLSQGYSIISSETPKIHQLTGLSYLCSSGMHADFNALCKQLDMRLKQYEFQMDRQANVQNIAQLLSYSLYMKRFFPFYTFNLLAGLDAEGNGKCYGYDAIGSFDEMPYVIQGSGQGLIVPILDNQLQGYNKLVKTYPQGINEVVDLVVDCFNAAAERDIYTGDGIEVIIMQKDQPTEVRKFELRKD